MLKYRIPQIVTLTRRKQETPGSILGSQKIRKALRYCFLELFFDWLLDYQDSNLDKQNQNLLCYHYTIVQTYVLSVKKRCKDRGLQANLQIFRLLFYFATLQIAEFYFAISRK